MPRAPDASHSLRTRSMRGSILILLRRAELSRHQTATCSRKSRSSSVKAFSFSLSTSIIPRTRPFDSLVIGTTISDWVVKKAGNQRGVLAHVADDQGLARFRHHPAESLRRRESRVSRRLVARSCNDHEISPHDFINANPAIIAFGPDHLCGALQAWRGFSARPKDKPPDPARAWSSSSSKFRCYQQFTQSG